VIGVVAFLTELYCASRYINATGCLNPVLLSISIWLDDVADGIGCTISFSIFLELDFSVIFLLSPHLDLLIPVP
jgi:hypothetical protein